MKMFIWITFEYRWDLLLPDCATREKEQKYSINFMNTQIVSRKQNISYKIKSAGMLIFEFQGIGWDLSMVRISYKLRKWTRKNEKFANSMNMHHFINIKTIRNMTASGYIVYSTLNNKLMRPASIIRLPNMLPKKQAKSAKSKRNWARKVSKPLETELYSKVFFFK